MTAGQQVAVPPQRCPSCLRWLIGWGGYWRWLRAPLLVERIWIRRGRCSAGRRSHARCCGLDVHKKSVVACVLISESDGLIERQVRTFKTMTADLLELADWLHSLGVTHVALESTGVYWRPVFNILEDDERALLLVNPQGSATLAWGEPLG